MESRPASCDPVTTNQSAIGFLSEMVRDRDPVIRDIRDLHKRRRGTGMT